ncbi:acyl-CoA dehydrogenase [Oribacterium sp. C9]|uniref:acyl-CoA dehydrogenase family protein n=1 Tax=Oribacterium sp. C9 TaxID=1943579 RepID=UPI00098EDE39|nr:acyl-CoA dehydrogenase family protein [Oribacterium sp. C9]OON86707.1 acyl-CoA dehydrogenase [Oribacterium sp. C9]
MAYLVSDEGKDLLRDVQEFVNSEIKEQVKDYDISGEWPKELFDQAVEMQLHMLDIPEEYGGLGLSNIDHAAILEAMGYGDAGFAVTLNGNGLSFKPLLVAGSEEQKKRYAEIIVNGGYGAFALTEPNAGCDAGNVKATAVLDGDEYVLNGTKCFCTNAQIADFYVVIASTDKEAKVKGLSAFLIDKGTKGVSVGSHENKMGIRTSITSDLILEDVRIPKENLLGKEGDGFKIAMETLDIARTWCAVIGVGVAQRCIDEAVAYAKTRVQFGKPLAKNEVIQFKIADMQMKTEAARQCCAHSLTLMERGEDYSMASATAKCLAGDAAMFAATEAVQILGGYGYSRDYPVEKLFRDAKIFQIFEGTNEIQRLVVGRSVIGKI